MISYLQLLYLIFKSIVLYFATVYVVTSNSTMPVLLNRAIAKYLSSDLPYELSSDDVYVTAGCTQAIEMVLSILARPGANVLLPRPGFPIYGLCATFRNLEIRYYDLLPDNGWEVNLNAVEALADHKTIAVVIINPGNPCGNVYTRQHLEKVSISLFPLLYHRLV